MVFLAESCVGGLLAFERASTAVRKVLQVFKKSMFGVWCEVRIGGPCI